MGSDQQSTVSTLAEQFGGEEPGPEREFLLAKSPGISRITCDINTN